MLTHTGVGANPRKEASPMTTRIHVGNLPSTASTEQLTQLFSPFGDVVETTIITDRDTGQSKGFAFVQMTQDAAAQSAIAQLNGTTLEDRTIRVSEAQARPARNDRYGDRPRYDDGNNSRR